MSPDAPTVHFNSAKVSKAGSCSTLTQLDHRDRQTANPVPRTDILEQWVNSKLFLLSFRPRESSEVSIPIRVSWGVYTFLWGVPLQSSFSYLHCFWYQCSRHSYFFYLFTAMEDFCTASDKLVRFIKLADTLINNIKEFAISLNVSIITLMNVFISILNDSNIRYIFLFHL